MDFLLECIGFPPDQDLQALAQTARERGEAVPWRGPGGEHLRLALGAGLEVRLDREARRDEWSLTPHYQSARRVRVALEAISFPDDAPDDALVAGWANPPVDEHPETPSPESYPLRALLSDARRLPRTLPRGHVLAMSLAGFALDVTYVGPDSGAHDPLILGLPYAAAIEALGGPGSPGGCVEVSLRVRSVVRLQNPLTHRRVELLEVETPGRALPFFVSPWQLEIDRLPEPRPGWRIEGTFYLCGRIAGGLGGPSQNVGVAFG
ncbi:MAG TPA: hypothetical protein VM509_15850 [Planctomycetota bacterium]|nr:hypothetical protein [Planctomycetota bacterium]